jgi:hypothetical protein
MITQFLSCLKNQAARQTDFQAFGHLTVVCANQKRQRIMRRAAECGPEIKCNHPAGVHRPISHKMGLFFSRTGLKKPLESGSSGGFLFWRQCNDLFAIYSMRELRYHSPPL